METAPAPLPHGRNAGLSPAALRDIRASSHLGVCDGSRTRYSRFTACPLTVCVRPPYELALMTGLEPAPTALQERCSASRTPSAWRGRGDSNSLLLPYQSSGQPVDLRPHTGASDRARTDTFSLTGRAHCHSCSTSVADPTGFEPAIYSVTSCRGRPDSPMSPRNWLRAAESNRSESAYETDASPVGLPASEVTHVSLEPTSRGWKL